MTVTGTWTSSFTGEKTDDWHCVRRLLAEGKIKPEKFITQRLPMDDLEKRFQIMRDEVVSVLAEYGSMLVGFPYANSDKYKDIDKRTYSESGIPDSRRRRLR